MASTTLIGGGNSTDLSMVTVQPEDILVNEVAVDKDGNPITGNMPNNGDTSATMDGLNTTSVTIPAGYTSGGTISLTDAIEAALAEI